MIHCENDLLLNLISLTPKNARHEFRQRIFKDWQWECAYCSKPLDENTATIDHIVPKFKGGHNVRANMCCCCSQCNKEKHQLHWKTGIQKKITITVKKDLLD